MPAHPRTSTPPCADCGTPAGPTPDHLVTPARYSGRPYGFPTTASGSAPVLCATCYHRHWDKAKRMALPQCVGVVRKGPRRGPCDNRGRIKVAGVEGVWCRIHERQAERAAKARANTAKLAEIETETETVERGESDARNRSGEYAPAAR